MEGGAKRPSLLDLQKRLHPPLHLARRPIAPPRRHGRQHPPWKILPLSHLPRARAALPSRNPRACNPSANRAHAHQHSRRQPQNYGLPPRPAPSNPPPRHDTVMRCRTPVRCSRARAVTSSSIASPPESPLLPPQPHCLPTALPPPVRRRGRIVPAASPPGSSPPPPPHPSTTRRIRVLVAKMTGDVLRVVGGRLKGRHLLRKR